MFLRIVRDIAKPQSFAVIDLLKRSMGLSVGEMAKALRMSYMGVKRHCVELEKKGLVDRWRRPGEVGRPELWYRLTAKAEAFYPEVGPEMAVELLQSMQQIYGASAADKWLFGHFAKKGEGYLRRVRGETVWERAVALAGLRTGEGCCSQVEGEPQGEFSLVEYHQPMKGMARAFPQLRHMETQMIGRVLAAEVERSEVVASGLSRVAWAVQGGRSVG